MKKKEERMEKHMNEVLSENKRLTDPLQKAKEEVDLQKKELANYEKDKQALAVSSNWTLKLCSANVGHKWTHEYCADDEGQVANDGHRHEELALGA